jgi:hypothetical protein
MVCVGVVNPASVPLKLPDMNPEGGPYSVTLTVIGLLLEIFMLSVNVVAQALIEVSGNAPVVAPSKLK